MERRISVIIPHFNMGHTIGACLEAAFASEYRNFEVIVVDDQSADASCDIITQFPCRLIRLPHRSGTSRARNTGALNSTGEIIFFIDADCLLQRETLATVNRVFPRNGEDIVIGGTYTNLPADPRFFSLFQSAFVHYAETKQADAPDYIAAHSMIMSRKVFDAGGGFPEDFLPIIEDVEFSHRLHRAGVRLKLYPEVQVQHIFGFSLWKSLQNAFRKTYYWCIYSLKNRDLLTDSGTSSTELKSNVLSFAILVLLTAAWLVLKSPLLISALVTVFLVNMGINRRFLKFLFRSGGPGFALRASLYYFLLYPLPVSLGAVSAFVTNIIAPHPWQPERGIKAECPTLHSDI